MGSRVKPEDLLTMKQRGEPISMLTCYDYPTAILQDEAEVDIVFVGDSVGVNMMGYETPQQVTMADMLHYTRVVRRGVKGALLLSDLPYQSYDTPEMAVENAQLLMDAGAEMVKLEGGHDVVLQVKAIVQAGMPLMGHVGHTPQTRTGARPVFGDRVGEAMILLEDALALEAAGVLAVVLECVPERIAEVVTHRLRIPTIGIGAGRTCDGQVLVTPDMLGINNLSCRFVKQYADLRTTLIRAFNDYQEDVKRKLFPEEIHRFLIKREELKLFRDMIARAEDM